MSSIPTAGSSKKGFSSGRKLPPVVFLWACLLSTRIPTGRAICLHEPLGDWTTTPSASTWNKRYWLLIGRALCSWRRLNIQQCLLLGNLFKVALFTKGRISLPKTVFAIEWRLYQLRRGQIKSCLFVWMYFTSLEVFSRSCYTNL